MRLINATTMELRTILGQDVPRYAILSHIWGDDEVSLQDLQSGLGRNTKGVQEGGGDVSPGSRARPGARLDRHMLHLRMFTRLLSPTKECVFATVNVGRSHDLEPC